MMNKAIQAKHIPEAEILAAIDATKRGGPPSIGRPIVACASTWDIQAHLNAYPAKVVLARLRSLYRRKVIDAQCDCGCRGDWCRPEESPWGPFP